MAGMFIELTHGEHVAIDSIIFYAHTQASENTEEQLVLEYGNHRSRTYQGEDAKRIHNQIRRNDQQHRTLTGYKLMHYRRR